jgi:hypothetical protein
MTREKVLYYLKRHHDELLQSLDCAHNAAVVMGPTNCVGRIVKQNLDTVASLLLANVMLLGTVKPNPQEVPG